MDIRRFGPGNRRPEGPPGTHGLTGQVIWSDPHVVVAELAFSTQAVITPHSAPDTTLMVVVSGGGWVQVGEERTRIRHGEAVVLPPGVPHGAWTDGSEMRVIMVEIPERDAPHVLDVVARHLPGGSAAPDDGATPAVGSLAGRMPDPADRDEAQGEPW